MKRFKKPSLWFCGGGLAFALIVTISFQNCGKAGFDAAAPEDGIAVGSISPEKSNAPLAFGASFDQISYMSCFGSSTIGKKGFYSVMAGGYGAKGGLRATQAFMDYANTKVPPTYPDKFPTPEKIKTFLSETPINISSSPQVAIRDRANLNDVRRVGSALTKGIDFKDIVADPTDDRIMDPLVRAPSSSPFVNYFPMAPASTRHFETKLDYNSNEVLTRDVRYDLGFYSMLTLTFAADAVTSKFRTPDSTNSALAYGRGYILQFAQPPQPYYLFAPENMLNNITEIDLESGNAVTSEPWSCPASLRLKIYRPKDRAACPPDPVSAMADPAYRERLTIIRRNLKTEYWDVSVLNLCAVPKEGDCYPPEGNSSGPYPVAYNQPSDCFSAASNYPPGSSIPTPWCPQYVSFCIK